ncbi:DinB family protein [Chryseobacterium oryctis]|uniref:DinB family protein n=1 Tax=Chryseobacterium oryctis TaxID=2952618 RepID=A0ABT3HSK9_9FLAO|nr:DinB family protein [Chryseobacterium oryctis]MCW3162773.1 DinB family protein [Chryseobacterium oryctis]
MKISSPQLIFDLKDITLKNIQFAEKLLQTSENELNSRRTNDSWSVLECLEHLNRYGDFYIPEINNRIAAANPSSSLIFNPGLLGNYFANSMLPKEKLNKMKTLKNMNPIHSKLDKRVVEEFVTQQKELLELLEKAKNVDLNKIKTSISITKLIKLKLGDTFRFVIYHNLRHVEQAKKVLTNI